MVELIWGMLVLIIGASLAPFLISEIRARRQYIRHTISSAQDRVVYIWFPNVKHVADLMALKTPILKNRLFGAWVELKAVSYDDSEGVATQLWARTSRVHSDETPVLVIYDTKNQTWDVATYGTAEIRTLVGRMSELTEVRAKFLGNFGAAPLR